MPFSTMLSKSLEKYMNSLKAKKNREQEQAYVIEGEKITSELLKSAIVPKRLLCTQQWYDMHVDEVKKYLSSVTILKHFELEKLSEHKSTPEVMAVVPIKQHTLSISNNALMLALDGIQDPGNMGTIIRSADWFGVSNIFVSDTCVDVYNPKVIQSAMGSIFRVQVMETSLYDLFIQHKHIPLIAADMKGESVHHAAKRTPCFLLIGSEGHGISDTLKPLINQYVSIPGHGKAESLNAAVATSILLSHWTASSN